MGDQAAAGKQVTVIGGTQFVVQKRGYDPEQVHGFAQSVARQMTLLQARNRELQALVDQRAAEVKPTDVFDRWGDETRRLFDTASETVTRVTAEAQEHARQSIEAANAEAAELRTRTQRECAHMRQEAEEVHAPARASADQQSAEIISAARLSAAVELDEARQAAAKLLSDADQIIHDAEEEAARIANAGQRERRLIGAELAAASNRLAEVEASRAKVVAQLQQFRGAIGDIVEAANGNEPPSGYVPEPFYDHVLFGDHQ